ncbi:MAG TPA: CorA family divalent cation transporter [Thermoplasmata archaeon]|nr:CorA family divalent cation transporter [Thermoplasmata archaeon]
MLERTQKEQTRKAVSVQSPQEPAVGIKEENVCPPKTPRAVCVALPHSGRPIRVSGDSPADLISTLQNATLAWVNFVVCDVTKEGQEIASLLGFSATLIPDVVKGYHANFVDLDSEIGIMVPAVRISGHDVESYPLIILVRKDLIVTIHSEEIVRLVQFSRYADHYMRKLPESMPLDDKLTSLLVRILDENNSRNFEYLREIEEQGDKLSALLLDTTSPRLQIGKEIYEIKHALITYMNTLWRTLDVLHSLRYGDAQLVSDNAKLLAQIGLLVEDVNRQISLSEHMSEVLASGLEVLQALYNNQLQILNNRMALTMTWLTILGTAVLVPNTLATVFGPFVTTETSMLIWYASLLLYSTAGATALAYWWVRKKVNLPGSPEGVK